MSENGEIYTAGKNFTLPPALTAWTNSTSVSKVMGPNGELVVSALGAMDDQHMLAPGLVTYRSSFQFNFRPRLHWHCLRYCKSC